MRTYTGTAWVEITRKDTRDMATASVVATISADEKAGDASLDLDGWPDEKPYPPHLSLRDITYHSMHARDGTTMVVDIAEMVRDPKRLKTEYDLLRWVRYVPEEGALGITPIDGYDEKARIAIAIHTTTNATLYGEEYFLNIWAIGYLMGGPFNPLEPIIRVQEEML